MGGRKSRSKGQRGEREVAKILNEKLSIESKRNLAQYQEGGFDLVGIPDYAIEVKRCEKISIEKWWDQCKEQAEDSNLIPLLFYRKSNNKWKVVMDIDTFCNLYKKENGRQE
mgnify:CR=1 FL=1|jgi:hypothetical protein|tara:strand:+ start:323 stop:658 length:336 start_codon:yes stop_codon:yes gene_type:complete